MTSTKRERFPKITTDLAYCLEPYIDAAGNVFKEGHLIEASSPYVARHPMFWAPAGLPTDAYHSITQQRHAARTAELDAQDEARRERSTAAKVERIHEANRVAAEKAEENKWREKFGLPLTD